MSLGISENASPCSWSSTNLILILFPMNLYVNEGNNKSFLRLMTVCYIIVSVIDNQNYLMDFIVNWLIDTSQIYVWGTSLWQLK